MNLTADPFPTKHEIILVEFYLVVSHVEDGSEGTSFRANCHVEEGPAKHAYENNAISKVESNLTNTLKTLYQELMRAIHLSVQNGRNW